MGNHGGGVGFNMAGNQELCFGNVKFEILGRGSTRQRGVSDSGGQESTLARVLRVGGC